jgi:hypothetical protein
MMRLVRIEIKKIITSLSIWGFIALCLAFNALLIFSNVTDSYAGYVAGISETAGVRLGEEFNQKLTAFAQNEYREQLINETSGLGNVFIGYNAEEIAEAYIDTLKLRGKIAEDMRGKYRDLQNVVNEKAERGDSLFLYFAGSTYKQHSKLFASVMPALCAEGVLVTLLVVLYALGYENMNRTEQIVYSSKIGRRIMMKKYIAAAIVGFCAYLSLMALTLALHFAMNDYGSIWNSNVSSGFNVISDVIMGFRPFTTWHSFTVLSYLLAVTAVSLGVLLCFSFAGFAAGTSIRNSYAAFLAIFLIGASCVVFPMILPINFYTRFGFMLTPIWLLLKQPGWFTDGDFDILWRDFETLGVCLSLAVLAALTAAASIKFRKKDIL